MMTERLTLMAVHAHPDDECMSTGGVLARYAREGLRTVLVTATRGEEGEVVDPAGRGALPRSIEPPDRLVVLLRGEAPVPEMSRDRHVDLLRYSGWNSARVLPSGSRNQADLPIPGVVATWSTVFSDGKS